MPARSPTAEDAVLDACAPRRFMNPCHALTPSGVEGWAQMFSSYALFSPEVGVTFLD